MGYTYDNRFEKHLYIKNYVDSGAKIVEFGGWAMPVQFSSIKEEHNAVRYNVGLLM